MQSMQATIEEPLICHTICSFLKLYDLDCLRRTSHAFLEAAEMQLDNVNIIGTCGIYTIRTTNVVSNDVYYLPRSDKMIKDIVFVKEYEFFNIYKIDIWDCMIIKLGIDHIIFGDNIGFVKDDHIEIWYHIICENVLEGRVPNMICSDYRHVDYGTYKMITKNDTSSWGDRFTCVELHGHTFDYFSHSKYSLSVENGIQVMTSAYKDGVTIANYLKLLNECTNDFVSKVKKIKFNKRLEFHYI